MSDLWLILGPDDEVCETHESEDAANEAVRWYIGAAYRVVPSPEASQ